MRRFGLIGYPLSHSFSQKYFTEKFQREGINDCVYENFPLKDISAFRNLLEEKNDLCGLNVTIPYKELVLQYLSGFDEVVKLTGACNCIDTRVGKPYGYNTDVIGFKRSLEKKIKPHHSKALILGHGGAAKAVAYVLAQMNIRFTYVTRNVNDEKKMLFSDITTPIVQEHTLIVNCTPIGTFPDTAKFPPIPYEGITSNHYLFDLVYNPEKTRFLEFGQQHGAVIQNGFDMLKIQAEESWRIWNT